MNKRKLRRVAIVREYVELEEGKLEIVKPVPQDLQPLVIELQEIYRKKQDPTDLAEYRRADNEL